MDIIVEVKIWYEKHLKKVYFSSIYFFVNAYVYNI